jgi:ATP-dependent RNA helicase DeaD
VLDKEEKIKFEQFDRGDRRERRSRDDRRERSSSKGKKKKPSTPVTQGMERFHISVGKAHGVKPASIVAAISDVSGLTDKDIGCIELHDKFSFIELPFGLSKSIFNELKKTKVAGEKLAISIVKNTASKPKFSKRKSRN